ncbi:hypothetical protein EDD21DRAFT_29335 [Dissophora ornata]|nr:hypothetical protein EDD21DRAFT_29335 [Dissophora ornata]
MYCRASFTVCIDVASLCCSCSAFTVPTFLVISRSISEQVSVSGLVYTHSSAWAQTSGERYIQTYRHTHTHTPFPTNGAL